MSASELPILIEKYLNQSLSNKESMRLESLLQKKENLIFFKSIIQNSYLLQTKSINCDANAAYQKTDAFINKNRKIRNKKIVLVLAIVLFLGSLIRTYFVKNGQNKGKDNYHLPATSNMASLHVESGHTYLLPSLGVDTLRNVQDDNIIAIINNGELTYPRETASAELHQLTVPFGVTYNVKLSDGSTVKLNSGSEMWYSSNFNELKERDIAFQGEAFFDIARDQKKPLKITSGEHLVEVLGTRFNLMAYPDDQEIITTLEHGSVKISEKSNTENAVILKPGDRFVWKEGIDLLTNNKEVLKSEMPKWIDGELNFEDTSFEEASKQLERRFDVKINIQSEEIKAYRFTGSFKPNDLQKILRYLQEAYSFEYTVENRIVEIY